MTRWQHTTRLLSGQPKHLRRLRTGSALNLSVLLRPRALWFQLRSSSACIFESKSEVKIEWKNVLLFFAHLPHISLPGSGPKNVQKTPLARDVCTKPICLPKRAFSRMRRLFGGRTKSERQVSLSNWRGWWQTSPVPRVLLEVYFRTSATFVKEASELTQKSVLKTTSNSTSFKKGAILSQRQERQKIEQLRNYE